MIKYLIMLIIGLGGMSLWAAPVKTRITATKEIVYNQEKSLISAYGRAKVERGADVLEADEIHATLEKTSKGKTAIKQVAAQGKVRIIMPGKIARGDKGTYNLENGTVTLEGHVIIVEKQNEITGDYAETNLITGLTRIVNKNSGAVKALLISTDMDEK